MALSYPSLKNINRKIGPAFDKDNQYKPDGSMNDNDRVEIGPTDLAFDEWAKLGLTPPNLQRMREYRLRRIVEQLQERELAGVLLFDPLNIRYATDSTNMQLWTTHNFARACFVSADGYIVLWDFHNCEHLSAHLPLVKEVRSGASFFYFESGEKTHHHATRFVTELRGIVKQHAGNNRRLAVDKVEVAGLRELDAAGFTLVDGQEVMELARSIKSNDEINAMRCSIAATEQAMHQMQIIAQPGMCEADIWSVLHAENIKRGGEWIECRILSSGPRTNPWFQECGPRKLQVGELLAFDTDLIGPYGFCADISRTWLVGDGEATEEQKYLYRTAYEHIQHNISVLKSGMSFTEVTQNGLLLPAEFRAQRYGVMMHGVGLCDEYPSIRYPEDVEQWGYSGQIEAGMTLCVEAYVGAVGGKEGVKLEEQVLITEQGAEVLSTYPFEAKLLS
ncbi:dimethylsulfonioproprionate lyase DddP [Vibrio sp. STUT-A11]|uniref:dimethylsulfonioproprionate lyase DddP n=1 Tax=Vibrio sp. STUT-A11 TaxID=2976236 RepID=UPI0022317D91|nr:dimethylsulfonioproprionate lyase DddP [Vibrio sp. STUT-A11]BDR13455.1 peptidase M24 [Vibrio sp. STUT-A11]